MPVPPPHTHAAPPAAAAWASAQRPLPGTHPRKQALSSRLAQLPTGATHPSNLHEPSGTLHLCAPSECEQTGQGPRSLSSVSGTRRHLVHTVVGAHTQVSTWRGAGGRGGDEG